MGPGGRQGEIGRARAAPEWLTARTVCGLGLAVALCVAAAWLFEVHSHLTFIADDWALLVSRQGSGPGYFLDPFHENILVGPALVYRLLMTVFGIDSPAPYFAFATALFLLSAVLLFVLLRRRVNDWFALFGAVLVLFLGAAFEDLLWAFQIGYFGSMAAGLGMLIALEREDERADGIACALLAVSVAFSSLGISFIAAAAVAVGMGRRPRLRRIYIPLLPLALYGLWWAGWGHTAESNLSIGNLEHLPSYVFDAAAAGMTSLLGLATGDGSEPSQPHLIWGRLMLIAVAGGVVWRIYRDKGISAGLAIVLALALVFWITAGLVRDEGRSPTSSRYQYISAIFLLLVVAESLRGVRLPPLLAGAAMAAIAVFAIAGGVSLLQREYDERWRPTGEVLRTSLGAVEMAGANADPDFKVYFAPKPIATARKYLEVERSYGSPGYSPDQLAGQSEANRGSGDLTLAQALGIGLGPGSAPGRDASCEAVAGSLDGETGAQLGHGSFVLRPEPDSALEVLLRKFADGFSVTLGTLEPGVPATLRIPADSSGRPWALGLVGGGRAQLCTVRPGAV